MNIQDILTDKLVVPPQFKRENSNTQEDEQLTNSIAETGVQQPLVVVREGENFNVIKGTRRLEAARFLGIPKVLCVIMTLAPDADIISFMGQMRVIADEKRQDLLPSQKAEILRTLIDDFGAKRSEIKDALGITTDTIGNYLDILKYIPKARTAIDSGQIKMHAARVFKGMTAGGQEMLLRKHWKDLTAPSRSSQLHEKMRALYPPEKYPALYISPETTAALIARPHTPRNKRVTKRYSSDEKKDLIADASLNKREIEKAHRQGPVYQQACMACSNVVAAILSDPSLHDMEGLDADMLFELKTFAEAY